MMNTVETEVPSSPTEHDRARKARAALCRQVSVEHLFEVVADAPDSINLLMAELRAPGAMDDLTTEIRSYHRPFGRGVSVFAGVDSGGSVIWIVRRDEQGEANCVWPLDSKRF
jgi:hypothetical protein